MRRWSTGPGIRISLAVVMVLATFASFLPAGSALATAAPLTTDMVRLDNMSAGAITDGSGTACVQASTATSEDYVELVFPGQFQLSTTTANWTTTVAPIAGPSGSTTYWPPGGTDWPTTLTATAVVSSGTTQTATFQFGTASAMNAHLYCFNWTGATTITNTGSAGMDLQGSVNLENSSSVVEETGQYAMTIVTSNQIVVTATVPPIFELTLPSNADTFPGNLAIGSVNETNGVTPTILTNAKGGWIMWVYDEYQGLTSASTSGHIGSVTWNTDAPTTLTAGTADYALDITPHSIGSTGDCTPTATAEYNGSATSGGELWTSWTEIGSCSGATGTSNGDGLKLQELAAYGVTTPAATDYTDTIYLAAAGMF